MGKTKEKIKKIKKSLKQYVPRGLSKLSGRAYPATYIPAIPEHLKRAKRANVMKKQRKASIKHIGRKETYSGKIAAGQKTRKIMGSLGYYLGTYPERRNILGFKYKTGKTDEGSISAIRKSLRRLPIKHLKGFGKGGAIKKVGKEVMSYVGKKLRKKKPVVKKSTNPYSLADWKQGIKHKGKGYSKGGLFAKAIQRAEQQGIIKKTNTATGTATAAGLSGLTEEELRRLRGYSKGGAIKKGITIIVDPRGKAKIKASVKQIKKRAEKELEDFIKNLNPKGFQSGGLVKPKSVRIAKRGWGKVIK